MRSSMVMALLMVASGCGAAADGSGGAGPDMAPVAVPHNFAQIQSQVIEPGCSFSVCHSAHYAESAGKLDFTTDAYAALVGQAPDNAQAKQQSMVRVKPCDPEGSFLYVKLTLPASQTDSTVGFGSHMPASNPSLAPAQLQGIHDWIARGAHRDEPDDASGTTCVH
jgi:hypothetical protein